MKYKVSWRKKIFCTTRFIYQNETQLGSLVSRIFTYSSSATFRSSNILFQTDGLFKQQTRIIHCNNNKVLGNVNYHAWKKIGYIELEKEYFEWRSTSLTGSNWQIWKEGEIVVSSANHWVDGEIFSSTDNPLYYLTGMYISDYYNRTNVAVFTAIFLIFMVAL